MVDINKLPYYVTVGSNQLGKTEMQIVTDRIATDTRHQDDFSSQVPWLRS